LKRVGTYFAAAAILGFCLAPLAWIFFHSLRSADGSISVVNYASVFEESIFARAILNSLLVASGTTLCCIALGASAAFAVAKLEFVGRRAVLAVALVVSMFPPIATVSPLFLIIRGLGLRDTLAGLVFPYTVFALPLTLWVLSSFFREIPDELYSAARLDGCSPFQAFWKIFLPLAAPGLATTAILVFVFSWNEFLFALTFVSSPEKRTIPVAIALFATGQTEPWPEIFAASVVVTVPLVLLTLALQRKILSGLTAGSVTGF